MASNSGPSTATGASVTDPLALNPAITSDTWTATGTGGATGYSASGSGNIGDSLDHPGRRLGHLHGDGRHPVLGHRHPVQHGHGPASDASTVTATDTDTLTAQATLSITKTDGVSCHHGRHRRHLHHRGLEHRTVGRHQPERGRHPAQPGLHQHLQPNLPAGVTFTAASDSWSLASLPAGQSVTLSWPAPCRRGPPAPPM